MPERSSYERKRNIAIPDDNPNGAILFQSNLNVKLTFAVCENCGSQGELAREQYFGTTGRASGKRSGLLRGAFVGALEGTGPAPCSRSGEWRPDRERQGATPSQIASGWSRWAL